MPGQVRVKWGGYTFFFGVAEKMENALLTTHTESKIIILDFRAVPFIDMTGLETLEEIIEKYEERGIQVYLVYANNRVTNKFKKVDILKRVAHHKVFEKLEDVLLQIKSEK